MQGYRSRTKSTMITVGPPNAIRPSALQALNNANEKTGNINPAPKITLAGKYSLPAGFVSGAAVKAKKEEVAEIPVWAQARNRNETAEERKARKAEVKEHRKQRRSEKKQSQEAVRNVNQNQISSIKTKDDLNHVTVFKYSA